MIAFPHRFPSCRQCPRRVVSPSALLGRPHITPRHPASRCSLISHPASPHPPVCCRSSSHPSPLPFLSHLICLLATCSGILQFSFPSFLPSCFISFSFRGLFFCYIFPLFLSSFRPPFLGAVLLSLLFITSLRPPFISFFFASFLSSFRTYLFALLFSSFCYFILPSFHCILCSTFFPSNSVSYFCCQILPSFFVSAFLPFLASQLSLLLVTALPILLFFCFLSDFLPCLLPT